LHVIVLPGLASTTPAHPGAGRAIVVPTLFPTFPTF